MRKMLIGFLFGVSLCISVRSFADAAGPVITGPSGRIDVEVTNNGERICEDPYFYKEQNIVSCE